MQQYGLQDRYVDVLVSDFSLVFWKDSVQFDAIITDRKSLLLFCFIVAVILVILQLLTEFENPQNV